MTPGQLRLLAAGTAMFDAVRWFNDWPRLVVGFTDRPRWCMPIGGAPEESLRISISGDHFLVLMDDGTICIVRTPGLFVR